jgi:glycosyltransferase involved in cell wall biosynthesis
LVVGLFCDTFPPEIDGVGMVVKSYARELSAAGDACYVISPEAPGYKGEVFPYQVLHYKGMTLPMAPQYRAGVPAWDFTYRMQAHGIKMDILHAHSPFGAGLEALRRKRIYDIPLIGSFHSKYYDDFFQITRSETIAQAVVKLIVSFYNACDEVWTGGEGTSQVLRKYGYEGDLTVMPNGTDLWFPTQEDARRAQEQYGLGDGPVLLYVGQQNWKKNIRRIIEAVALYRRIQPDVRMVMVGQGPHAEEIKAYTQELGLSESFAFTGQIMDREAIMSLYARADLFLFPSLYDTAGLVVCEAAAAGTPSLLVEGSCAAECVRDGENGFLCEDDPNSICDTIARVIADGALRRRVGEAARETIPVPWSAVIQDVRERYLQRIQAYDTRGLRLNEK